MSWKFKFVRSIVRCSRGATAIEASFVLLPFLLFVFGTIEVSRYYFAKHELSQLANEISRSYLLRYGATLSTDNSSVMECWNEVDWQKFSSELTVLLKPEQIRISEFPGTTDGCPFFDGTSLKPVKVQIDYNFSFLSDLIGYGEITLSEYRTFNLATY